LDPLSKWWHFWWLSHRNRAALTEHREKPPHLQLDSAELLSTQVHYRTVQKSAFADRWAKVGYVFAPTAGPTTWTRLSPQRHRPDPDAVL
jgi:hypothetical protein